MTTPTQAHRCPAAYAADPRPCEGQHDAVRIVDRTEASADACLLHGAVLLASLDGGRVYPLNGPDGAAITVYTRAQTMPAFDFLARRADAGTLRPIKSCPVDRDDAARSGCSGSGNGFRSRWIEDTVSVAMGDA